MPQIEGEPSVGGVYNPVIIAQDSLGNTSNPTTLQITVNTPGVTAPTLFPLPLMVEILVNGAWTDISEYVYQRDDITINGGRTDRSQTPQPATMTMTLNNRDGRFSGNNISSPYYPLRNTQIRLSLVNAQSTTGTFYTGYRFWGEVKNWPPQSDITGQDIYVQITATGPLRRFSQSGGEGSALQRYYASLTNNGTGFGPVPIAYWTCEEDPDSTQIGAGVQGAANMVVTNGNPIWKAVSNFNGSGPIGIVNYSTWVGQTGSFGASGNDVYSAPGVYQWTASTPTVDARVWAGGGGGKNGILNASSGRCGGGGGELAEEANLVVTPGSTYTLLVGNGGPGGAAAFNGVNGQNGQNSSFTGDLKVVLAHGGQGGSNSPGAGGSGSNNSIHHSGGAGGSQTSSSRSGGGGGGGAGGLTGGGQAGGNTANQNGGLSGPGGTGGGGRGGIGGTGGAGDQVTTAGQDGFEPGGGGGAGGFNTNDNFGSHGGSGDSGQVQLLYAASGATPPANVVRFIMFVPPHGGNNAGVMVRAFTGGAIARFDCQYRNGGNIRLFGYNVGNTQLFDSGNLNVNADGRTLMVSMELTQHGTAVNWSLSAIAPGNPGVGNQVVTGTLTGTTLGSVSSIVVGPNQDISKTAIGHISVQYAFVPLWQVSDALDGHQYEAGPERFIRIGNEQAMDNRVEYSETNDHWGFEDGTTQSWAATNGTVSNSGFTLSQNYANWPVEGSRSLLLTANGSGSPSASSPTGLSGLSVQTGDCVSISMYLMSPVGLNHAYIGLKWYDASGNAIAGTPESDGPDTVIPANQPVRMSLTGKGAIAPSLATFFAVTFGDHHTDTSGTQIYCDDIKISPQMGPQERHALHQIVEEVEDIDRGIVRDAKDAWGMKMGTRISIANRPVSLALDYSQGYITPPLQPTLDVQNLRNNIVVHRHKGSKVEVVLWPPNPMSVEEPPAGAGRTRRTLKALAAADEQLAALASQLLTEGTTPNERYPTISIDLGQANVPGNAIAGLMPSVAGVEIGYVIEIDTLPPWYPSTSTKQLVLGYSEVINTFKWVITWNCDSYLPYVQVVTSLRRW